MFAWREYKNRMLSDSGLMDLIDQEYKRKVEENRRYIKTIAEVLLLTATQKQAQRGHRESEYSDNRGNFIETLTVIANHDALISEKMREKGNAKYTSGTIQKEILECLANMVRDDIVKEVKESEVFSVIADESKDLQKKEQLSLVVRISEYRSVQLLRLTRSLSLPLTLTVQQRRRSLWAELIKVLLTLALRRVSH
ncbi:Zinc finger MYM-type protein 1 [Anabarilius grahami]|uniref:Zinc finger MYM-type protein 1 n=1 Tax=Anabarilius grahami TaxID=495550 RepID=A0A3N0YFD6_ANAGA|nr:Zinc finger MYM-type protein 1 [Anabarilius grahami]